jgi:hypothetical protein
LSGKWNDKMEFKNSKSHEHEVLFDAKKSTNVQKIVRPEAEQEDNESGK